MNILNKTIDDIILQDSTRGMFELREEYFKEYCKIAVNNFLKIKKGKLFLYTGFYVNGFAETDGPLGTYFLAKALKNIGFTPIIITDNYCKDYFKEFETIYLSHDDCKINNIEELLNKYEPTCHIAIERCSQNINNSYLNSKGVDISEFTPALDFVFKIGSKTKPSFAIGDGGNEIGMGNFKTYLKNQLKMEASCTEADFLILASVSNWGAYGFIAYLEKYLKLDLLPSFEELSEYLDYIVSLGAVDGILNKNVSSVDGKEWYLEKIILDELKNYKLEE